jgi:hypothetical protein
VSDQHLMSNNTRIVTTNVTCEITAFDLNVCRQISLTSQKSSQIRTKIEEMKIEVSERELEIDNKDGVIDSFTMSTCHSKYRRVSDADHCFQTFPCATSWFVTRCVRLAVRRST